MEKVTAHVPFNRMVKTRNVTELFPSNEVEHLSELVPFNWKSGESNGEKL
jgi:hypothetical protein